MPHTAAKKGTILETRATVGQIDAEALFYLRSRGIGEDEARGLLVHAFASDIIDRVTIEPLRNQLEEVLLGYLPKEESAMLR